MREARPWRSLARSGLLMMVPAIAITFALWPLLPAAYGGEAFDRGIPAWLLVVEHVLRVGVFAAAALLDVGVRAPLQRLGWLLYGTGLLLYLGSYLAQILAPNSGWSTSPVGFTALAWTPLIWLAGIGLVCTQTWLPLVWNRAVYPLVSVAFVAAHGAHAYLAYLQRPPT